MKFLYVSNNTNEKIGVEGNRIRTQLQALRTSKLTRIVMHMMTSWLIWSYNRLFVHYDPLTGCLARVATDDDSDVCILLCWAITTPSLSLASVATTIG